jgi:hypothetical protein
MDNPQSVGREEEYKYKYFKYLYKLRKLEGRICEHELDRYSDTSSDSDLESLTSSNDDKSSDSD